MLRLKFERQQRQLTQYQLSLATGINQFTVSLIERRRVIPTSDQLQRLASALGVEPAEDLMKDIGIAVVKVEVTEVKTTAQLVAQDEPVTR